MLQHSVKLVAPVRTNKKKTVDGCKNQIEKKAGENPPQKHAAPFTANLRSLLSPSRDDHKRYQHIGRCFRARFHTFSFCNHIFFSQLQSCASNIFFPRILIILFQRATITYASRYVRSVCTCLIRSCGVVIVYVIDLIISLYDSEMFNAR